jgi:hypothetical protein
MVLGYVVRRLLDIFHIFQLTPSVVDLLN